MRVLWPAAAGLVLAMLLSPVWGGNIFKALSTEQDVVLFGRLLPHLKWRTFVSDSRCQERNGFRNPTDPKVVDEGGEFVLKCLFNNTVRTTVRHVTVQVIRCDHPPPELREALIGLPVNLEFDLKFPMESEVTYTRPTVLTGAPETPEHHLCASLILRDKAPFVEEWLRYHFARGVSYVAIYDHRSEDRLEEWVKWLSLGYNVTYIPWHYDETQPAMFGHFGIVNQHRCRWAMFMDIDEFLFVRKAPHHIGAFLSTMDDDVGGVEFVSYNMFPAADGPIYKKPDGGVIANYICRRPGDSRAGKSIVRLAAMHYSTQNSIHFWCYNDAYHRHGLNRKFAYVYHYKFQAWEVFRARHRARISPMGKVFDFQQTDPDKPDETFLREYTECTVHDSALRDFVHCNMTRRAREPCAYSESGSSEPRRVLLAGVGGPASGLREIGSVMDVELAELRGLEVISIDWRAALRPVRDADKFSSLGVGEPHHLFDKVLHHVRHPLLAIASALELQPEDWAFIEAVTPEVPQTLPLLRRALLHWVSWNLLLETIADERYRVEDVTSSEMCHAAFAPLRDCSPLPPNEDRSHIRSNHQHVSIPSPRSSVTWQALEEADAFVAQLAKDLALKYGYDLTAP